MLRWIVVENQESEVRNRRLEGQNARTPPYYGQRDNGWERSMEMPIFRVFFNAQPLSKLVGQRDNGQMTMSRPHIVVPPVHRIEQVDANACFQRGF